MVANEKNLKPLNTRAKSEQRKIQSKGGKAAAESRREKKLLRDYMDELLSLPISDLRKYNRLARLGLDPESIDNRALLVAALFAKAAADGDVAAFKEIRNLIGEDAVPVNEPEPDALSAALESLAQELTHDK